MSAASAVPSKYLEGKILVASPHAHLRKQILKALSPPAGQTVEAAGGADALMKLERSEFRTLLLDPALEDLDVDELVATVRARYPELNVVMLERSEEPEQLSFNLIGELPDNACGTPVVEETVYKPTLQPAAAAFPEHQLEIPGEDPDQRTTAFDLLPGMIVRSARMQQVCRLARLVAPRDTAVLIVGATGTGKELVARGIHALGRRSRGPFVVVNCAAIPESLLEAELFGFTRGAFTGAFQSRLGRIHAAHGGTLLLDEVGELPLSMQAKLLRFVQEGEVQRLGSADLFRVDARLIAATNADLLQRVREKQFREDLYYRLAVFPLELPPLRDRGEDILPLAQHFLEAFCRQAGVPPKFFTAEAAELLRRRSWPGNVRELQHAVERAFVLADAREQIRSDDLVVLSEMARD
jgi:transcriptional regulator with GAF, ATPase, and Fis domain